MEITFENKPNPERVLQALSDILSDKYDAKITVKIADRKEEK